MSSVAHYEPGAVAVATVRGIPNVRIVRGGPNHWVEAANADRHYMDGIPRLDGIEDIRPLVVLDLGDAEELAAAVRSLREAGENSRYHVEGYSFTFAIADQIEDQIKPPRIPEPGLWAVVEAKLPSSGQSRLRVIRVGKSEWQPVSYNYSNPLAWGDLIDPTLIRDGVQP